MSILKIRDENGNVHPIAIMKGDKGDGVPDGGTKGQVIKKTESGTEWSDFTAASKCAALFTNTDTAISSASITQRGLYEVKMACAVTNNTNPAASAYDKKRIWLVSISDLTLTQSQEFVVGYYTLNGEMKDQTATIAYANQTFTSSYYHRTADGSSAKNNSYIAEVRLIIPYE